jgi:hypothetical protein
MYSSPLVLGVDCRQSAGKSLYLADTLSNFGNNTGNMVFSEGLYRSIFGSRRSDYHFDKALASECDVIVIAAANWLNGYEDFGWLLRSVEATGLPLILVGLGVQVSGRSAPTRISDGTMGLVRLAAQTSAFVGVRGSFSAAVLRSYGVENVKVVGCPSFLLAPSDWTLMGTSLDGGRTLIHGTRHQYNGPDIFNGYFYRQAFSRELDILLQSELPDMYFSLGRTNNSAITKRSGEIVAHSYGGSVDEVSYYLNEHGRVYFDYDLWRSEMKRYSVTVGTRIHGTIMSLLSGVPSVLFCHDERTRELAESMPVPFVSSDVVDVSKDLDLDRMLELAHSAHLDRRFADYRTRFLDFLHGNGLQVT